jgi:hypothetical protein
MELQFMEEKIRLLPHNVVQIVDTFQSGDTPRQGDGAFFYRGPDVACRIIGLLEQAREGRGVPIELVGDPKLDYICSGSTEEDPKCFGINNPWWLGCLKESNREEEVKIAGEMDLVIGESYSFAELVEGREKTSYRRD